MNDINFEWQYWQWVESYYKSGKAALNTQLECQQYIVDCLESFGIKVLRKLF